MRGGAAPGPQWDWRRSHLTHNLASRDPACCLKGLRNVEQIPSALSAWARSPLAGLKSQGPARELTEFHMEARNRGTSCLSLTACPTLALICRRLVHSALFVRFASACLKSGLCMFCLVFCVFLRSADKNGNGCDVQRVGHENKQVADIS